MTDEKDYAAAIEGIDEMDIDKLHELYSQILATAHDVGYEVPDDQLVETDDTEVLRGIIPALHEGLVKFNAGLDVSGDEEGDAGGGEEPEPAPSKRKKPAGGGPVRGKKSSRGGEAEETGSKTALGQTTQDTDEEDTAMTTTAKKAAAPKKAASKKAAPAAKPAGKAAKANARTPAAPRASKWSEKATIKVLAKDNPTRKGTGRFERVANLLKHDGKPVSEYLKKGGRTGTLSYAIEQEWVKVVG